MRISLSKPEHPNEPSSLLSTLRSLMRSQPWKEGGYAMEFERKVAECCGSVYAVPVNTARSAISMVCSALHLSTGVQVICPSYTEVSSINSLLDCGITPMFADLNPKTFSLNLTDVEKKLTKKTRAVWLVHQFGIPADATAFLAFCQQNNLFLIEEVVGGLGSRFDGKSLGTFGHVGILRFHPKRVLAIGDGEILVTDDEEIASSLRHHPSQDPDSSSEGNNGHGLRMSEFQAAIGLWALHRNTESIWKREQIALRYDEALRPISGVQVFWETGRGEWNRAYYPIRISAQRRDRVVELLQQEGIQTSYGPLPAHQHPYMEARMHPPRLPETELAYQETILLPMHTGLTLKDQQYVIGSLQKLLE